MSCFGEDEFRKRKVTNVIMIWTKDICPAHDFVFISGVESVNRMYDERNNGSDIVEDFLKACLNVRSLRVVERFGRWATAVTVEESTVG